MDSSVSPKDEIWFLRVCHHISNAVYHKSSSHISQRVVPRFETVLVLEEDRKMISQTIVIVKF